MTWYAPSGRINLGEPWHKMRCLGCRSSLSLIASEMYLLGMVDHEERRDWICEKCKQEFTDSILVDDDGRTIRRLSDMIRRRSNGD